MCFYLLLPFSQSLRCRFKCLSWLLLAVLGSVVPCLFVCICIFVFICICCCLLPGFQCMFWLPIVVVGRVVPCHFATWALVISAPNPPVALQCYQTQGVWTPWGEKGGRGLLKKVWERSLRQVGTFVGASSICPHSFSGSAFCSWFWDCLSCFGLPQPAHMITSVDHLKTMDPGGINAICTTFVRRCSLLGLNCFYSKLF